MAEGSVGTMTINTIGALVLPLYGDAEYHQIPKGTLAEVLHNAVGGWLEAVYLDNGCTMFVNEEGRLQGLEHNKKATVVMYYYARRLVTDTHTNIVGPAVIVGPPDYEGNEQGLTLKELGDFARVIEFGKHPSHPLSHGYTKTATDGWQSDVQGIY
jgi:hypothetical protein